MRAKTILFVDDETKSRKYFDRIFRRQFETILAADGKEALEVFCERKAEIGIVVTDQMMPRMTGLDLLKELATRAPEVIRILSTAYTDSDLVKEAAATELIDYSLVKPWDIDRVTSVLEQAAVQFEKGRGEQPASNRVSDDLRTLT